MRIADAVRTARGLKLSHAQRFAQHVVPEVVRPARIIWNQAVGGVFLVLAVWAFSSAFRYYDMKTHAVTNPAGLGLSLFFGLVTAFFSLTSFLKARSIGRRARAR